MSKFLAGSAFAAALTSAQFIGPDKPIEVLFFFGFVLGVSSMVFVKNLVNAIKRDD